MEVLLTTKVKRLREPYSQQNVAELHSSIKCCGSCQFLRGLWIGMSNEVEEIHMRTDAKNLVTTARTTHLPERKETILIISMLRKEACSGCTHDLAHISNSTFFGRLLDEVIGESRQFEHISENKEIVGC